MSPLGTRAAAATAVTDPTPSRNATLDHYLIPAPLLARHVGVDAGKEGHRKRYIRVSMAKTSGAGRVTGSETTTPPNLNDTPRNTPEPPVAADAATKRRAQATARKNVTTDAMIISCSCSCLSLSLSL